MKETPIIFSAELIHKILDGSKTQSRRVIKPQPIMTGQFADYKNITTLIENLFEYCPYGQAGDRLIIKEAWAAEKRYDHLKPSEIPLTATIFYFASIDDTATMGRKRSARFMCNWMSRARPEITEVRAERVQEISFEDCLAEGIVHTKEWGNIDYKAPEPLNPTNLSNEEADKEIDRGWVAYTQQAYRQLWDSLNAKRGYGWSVNPWVWLLSFKMVG